MKLISRHALAAFMDARHPVPGKRITYEDLAAAATNKLLLMGSDRQKVSKATIGHLVTGHTKSTHPDVAKAICAALEVPVKALFVAEVSIVSRDVPGRAA